MTEIHLALPPVPVVACRRVGRLVRWEQPLGESAVEGFRARGAVSAECAQ